jgi:hypothetical protein
MFQVHTNAHGLLNTCLCPAWQRVAAPYNHWCAIDAHSDNIAVELSCYCWRYKLTVTLPVLQPPAMSERERDDAEMQAPSVS